MSAEGRYRGSTPALTRAQGLLLLELDMAPMLRVVGSGRVTARNLAGLGLARFVGYMPIGSGALYQITDAGRAAARAER